METIHGRSVLGFITQKGIFSSKWFFEGGSNIKFISTRIHANAIRLQ